MNSLPNISERSEQLLFSQTHLYILLVGLLLSWQIFGATCSHTVLKILHTKHDENSQRTRFLEDVQSSFPSIETKNNLLTKIRIPARERFRIIRTSFIQGENAENRKEEILKRMRLSRKKRKFLADNNILKLNTHEYEYLMTRIPLPRNQLRPDIFISYVNKDGILENAIVKEIKGDNLSILPHTNKLNQDDIVIKKEKAYNPILPHQHVIYDLGKGAPEFGIITDIPDNNRIETHLANGLTRVVPISTLGIRPKEALDIRPPEYFERNTQIANSLEQELDEIKSFAANTSNQSKKAYLRKLNNTFVFKLQKEMKRQGIFTSIIKQNNRSYALIIKAVHPHGNKIARSYFNKTRLYGVESLTISPMDYIKSNFESVYIPNNEGRLELGLAVALQMLQGKRSPIFLHEMRHIILQNRQQYKYNQHSIYDHHLFANGQGKINDDSKVTVSNLKNFYDDYQSISELYTYTFDILFHLQYWKRALSKEEMAKRKNSLRNVIIELLVLSDNTYHFTNKISNHLDSFTIKISPETVREGFIQIVDDDSKGIMMRLSSELFYIFNYPFFSLKMMNHADFKDLRRLISDRNPLTKSQQKLIDSILTVFEEKKMNQQEWIRYYNNLIETHKRQMSTIDLLIDLTSKMKKNDIIAAAVQHSHDVITDIIDFSEELRFHALKMLNLIDEMQPTDQNNALFDKHVKDTVNFVNERDLFK